MRCIVQYNVCTFGTILRLHRVTCDTMDDRDDSASRLPFYWLTAVLLQVFWTSDNKLMCLSWMTGTPTSICHSWLDDHRKYAGRGSITVWGISGCGKTMELLSLAYVHTLVVNNQAVPRSVHNIQNYRRRIKRKICLTVSFHNYDCKDIWKCALIPRHGVPRPWHTGNLGF